MVFCKWMDVHTHIMEILSDVKLDEVELHQFGSKHRRAKYLQGSRVFFVIDPIMTTFNYTDTDR